MASMLQDRPSSLLGTPRRSFAATPHGSPLPWFGVDHQPIVHFIPHRSSLDCTAAAAIAATAMPRPTSVRRGERDLAGFSTPQMVTLMGREHDLVEFRTPQHPTGGTNHWGGASPLLSRNIPKQSLEINYLKFNPLADDGGYFGTDFGTLRGTPVQSENDKRGQDARRKRDWILQKFGLGKKGEREVYLGNCVEKKTKKRSWLSKRWPQGW